MIAENSELRNNLTNLNKKSDTLSCSMDDLEQYSRGSNLLIHGIDVVNQGATETDLNARMVHFLNNNLGLTISDQDIRALHRLPKTVASAHNQHGIPKPPPVLIQFVNGNTRNVVLSKRPQK